MTAPRKSVRLSTSFTPAEVDVLAALVRNALRSGGNQRELVGLRRKFEAMAQRSAVVRELHGEAKAS